MYTKCIISSVYVIFISFYLIFIIYFIKGDFFIMVLQLNGKYIASTVKENINKETGEITENIQISLYQIGEGTVDMKCDSDFYENYIKINKIPVMQDVAFKVKLTEFNGRTYFKIVDILNEREIKAATQNNKGEK